MEDKINMNKWRNPIKPLLRRIEDSIELMVAYINLDSKTELIVDGQLINQHIHGPLTYDYVLQTIEATSESKDSYFKQLGSMAPKYISKREFKKLFKEYGELRLECYKFHKDGKDSHK